MHGVANWRIKKATVCCSSRVSIIESVRPKATGKPEAEKAGHSHFFRMVARVHPQIGGAVWVHARFAQDAKQRRVNWGQANIRNTPD